MGLSTKLVAQVVANLHNDPDLSKAVDRLVYTQRRPLGDGTGADQADLLWHDQRTVNASSDDDLDLAGVLEDAFGQTLTFARVKGLVIAAAAGNGDDLAVGGAASPFASWLGDATDIVLVRPGGVLALFAPDATAYPVTPGTGDELRVTNTDAGASADYDIIVVGASS